MGLTLPPPLSFQVHCRKMSSSCWNILPSCFLDCFIFFSYFFLLFWVRWDWVSWYCSHYWPNVPAPDDRWWWLWRNWWKEDWHGETKFFPYIYYIYRNRLMQHFIVIRSFSLLCYTHTQHVSASLGHPQVLFNRTFTLKLSHCICRNL
jgi:hypothetical protein